MRFVSVVPKVVLQKSKIKPGKCLVLGLFPAMKEWVAREGQTHKRRIMLSTFSFLLLLFDLYHPVEIKGVKVSSKIGKMLKKPVPEVVLDL